MKGMHEKSSKYYHPVILHILKMATDNEQMVPFYLYIHRQVVISFWKFHYNCDGNY